VPAQLRMLHSSPVSVPRHRRLCLCPLARALTMQGLADCLAFASRRSQADMSRARAEQ
jgi:hypothetical protein